MLTGAQRRHLNLFVAIGFEPFIYRVIIAAPWRVFATRPVGEKMRAPNGHSWFEGNVNRALVAGLATLGESSRWFPS